MNCKAFCGFCSIFYFFWNIGHTFCDFCSFSYFFWNIRNTPDDFCSMYYISWETWSKYSFSLSDFLFSHIKKEEPQQQVPLPIPHLKKQNDTQTSPFQKKWSSNADFPLLQFYLQSRQVGKINPLQSLD